MKIDTTLIPEETGKRFGQVIAEGLRDFLKTPGAMEMLDERTRARKARKEAHGRESIPAAAD